jgi:hypothetical protein
MPLSLKSSGGGSVTLDTPSTASTFTLTVPAITGTAVVTGSSATVSQAMLASNVSGNGPAIRVARTGSAQALTINVQTKVLFDTTSFDTNSNFSIANSRFTPTVAGYYQVNSTMQLLGTISAAGMDLSFYKNGSRDTSALYLTGTYANPILLGSALIYCNGSTDYLEVYVAAGSSGISVNYSAANNVFTAFLARAA